MNICFLNSEKHWGGGEKWHFKMAQLFHEDGHNVHMCVYPSGALDERAKQSGICTTGFKIGRYSFLNPLLLMKISKFFKDNDIQVVIMNNPIDLKIGVIAGKMASVPTIIYRRGMPHPIRNTAFNRWLFGNLTYAIAISEEVKRSLLVNNRNMIADDKILLYYNSIDRRDYNPTTKKFSAGDKVIYGTTGRLVEQKGQYHLIEAAAMLKSKGYKFEVRIAGIGPLEDELRALIADNDLRDEVKLVGFLKTTGELDTFLNSIDVFAFPSYFEGSAVSIVEAIYFGKPTIAFNVSTMPELVIDSENGYLVEFQNSELFASAMQVFIDNPKMIAIMGEKALEYREQYDLHNVFNRLKGVLERSLDNKSM